LVIIYCNYTILIGFEISAVIPFPFPGGVYNDGIQIRRIKGMNKLFIRQYVPAEDSGASCAPCAETNRYLLSMIENLSPKLANLDIQPVLQLMEIHTVTDRNAGKLNYVTFFAPETGIPEEKSIEEVLGVPVRYEECEGCHTPRQHALQDREPWDRGQGIPGSASRSAYRRPYSRGLLHSRRMCRGKL
jgi:hypothetical protein